jgi:hypothetical protein
VGRFAVGIATIFLQAEPLLLLRRFPRSRVSKVARLCGTCQRFTGRAPCSPVMGGVVRPRPGCTGGSSRSHS